MSKTFICLRFSCLVVKIIKNISILTSPHNHHFERIEIHAAYLFIHLFQFMHSWLTR